MKLSLGPPFALIHTALKKICLDGQEKSSVSRLMSNKKGALCLGHACTSLEYQLP